MGKMKKEKEMVKKKNIRAQVTIFIILALAIVVVLALLFIRRGDIIPISTAQVSPVYQIKTCMSDAVKQELDFIASQGGSLNPDNYFMHEGNKLQYLCYSSEYYEPCVMQKPMLKQDIEKELTDSTKDKILACISVIKDSLENKGYTVKYDAPEIKIELVLNSVVISADNINMEISKSNTETYKTIKTEISSKMYEFVMIASSISNLEAHYGNSETMIYMTYYPSLKVQKIPQSEGTRVYILSNSDTKEKFMFASRSMTYPVGVTGE